ncbi:MULTISPECIES: isocitrate lyase/PEP mutase family protein [unclassified Novosphingobium]|uniref:isocitrate lyase/PEP mutase family protein n=1 Tax=unclassified Novosphingobium TaxID=2644732 RepID=UPI00086B34AC|nr:MULTISPECIES: isocitrate lyase/PEP mutase family protein [unclassified Novosphingobium]MDR6707237.1 2-methylisocitrate lyase-like PEP mutase family enzyme [Novosphingobium sp. 1748]ODU82808.1 MAG: carboxyvinyl-carboxyphosphonate phosphorylmutase [Novosphingobium sp. SCN 63-17]OJX96513.1 MAG: carboxyvinyl-carboxyphosphonate phosphorylmutase [Novosphingobium sp. 63-713]
MANPILRQKLESGKFFVVPGIQDMITAAIANKVGFDIVYGTGYWLTASAWGLPDAGIATYTEMLNRMTTLVRTSNSAVIADGDTGYGGLLNVHHTVKGYEAAGVTCIQLEDQEFPKKCGHTPFRRCIPVEDMVDKIKVAVDARESEDFLIIARSDARQSEGFDALMRRMEAYDKAGAHIIFPEALESEEEMAKACSLFEKPVMANMANGGSTPIPNASVLEEIGYAYAIYPSLTSLVAATAMEKCLRDLKDHGIGEPEGIFNFKEFCGLIGFNEVWDFEKKWAK